MLRMDEEAWEALMKKRAAWQPGRVLKLNTEREGGNVAVKEGGSEPTPSGAQYAGAGESLPRPGSITTKAPRARARPSRNAPGTLRGIVAPGTKSLEVNRAQSGIEIILAQQIQLRGLPVPKRNYLFMPGRKLELDFAWPERMIALEVQGMVHRIRGRFKADMEKRALALLDGWRVLEVGGDEIRSGQASWWLEQLLGRNA